MPAASEVPLHRLHIMVEEEDYKWLKKELGESKAVSEIFRRMVKRLRGQKSVEPQTSVMDLLDKINLELGNGIAHP